MAIQLLGFPTILGLPRTAPVHGPEALRAAGLLNLLRQGGASVADLGDMQLPDGDESGSAHDRVRQVVAAAQRQANLWRQHRDPEALMLTIGGDHTTSLGTIMALAERGEPFDIVWIDAHGDYNTIDTSPSGNPHGMVLSLARGLMPEIMPEIIRPEQLHLWGIRDLDAGERELMTRDGLRFLCPHQTRQDWHKLLSRLGPNVFISFDIDSVEPAEAPATRTPVPGGFSTREALDLVSLIALHRRVVALDVVEFHPDLDQQDRTLGLSLEVICRVLNLHSVKGYSAAARC